MKPHVLEADGRPAFVVLPYEDYQALLDLVEDVRDVEAIERFARGLADGDEETVPVELLDRLLAGEPPLRVWREHRGLSGIGLAAAVGVTPAHISKLESGRSEPSLKVLRRLAGALDLDLEDLVGD